MGKTCESLAFSERGQLPRGTNVAQMNLKTYEWWPFPLGGGNLRMKIAVCDAIGRGVNIWSRKGEENVSIFGLWKSTKEGPTQNQQQSSTIACAELSFAPGCGDELVFRLRLAFSSGCSNDSNVSRLAMRSSLIGAAQSKQRGKALQPRTSDRTPARNRKISAQLPLLCFPPFDLSD